MSSIELFGLHLVQMVQKLLTLLLRYMETGDPSLKNGSINNYTHVECCAVSMLTDICLHTYYCVKVFCMFGNYFRMVSVRRV